MQENSYHGSVLDCIAFLSKVKDGEYEVKPYHEKRSLSANGYYWALVDKIAQEMNSRKDTALSKDDIHRQMLHDYGTWEYNTDGSPKWVILPKNEPLPKDGYFYDMGADVTVKGENSGDEIGHAYIIIRGSHTYNSKEMSTLLNGVIQEAQSLGIETMTPAEIEEMLRMIGDKPNG